MHCFAPPESPYASRVLRLACRPCRRLHHPRDPAGPRRGPRGGRGRGGPQARQRQERPPLEALRRGDQGRARADRSVHRVPQTGKRLPRAQAGPARPRLPHGHGPVPRDRRAGHRRRQRRPLRSHPVPPGRRPRRALGREPLRHGDAQHADGAHRRLLVWELGGSVVSDRRHPRHHERSARRSRPVPRVRLGRSGRVLPVPFAGNADAGPRPDVRQGALQLPVGAGVPDEHGSRGPADLPDESEPRDGHGSGLPLDSRRRPLLDRRAACDADAPALRRRPGRLLRLGHEELLA